MRRFKVDKIPAVGECLVLDAGASHHMLTVLRHKVGAEILIFDGSGQQALAVIEDDEGAVIAVTGPITFAAAVNRLHLVIGIPKGPSMDLAVRMATEAGATDIHPILAKRSVATGDRGDRWRRIAESAAQQCGRADIPIIHPLSTLRDVLEILPHDVRIGVAGAPDAEPATGPAAILIGPEGGWSDHELAHARSSGARPVGLGPWILRTDTAAAVAVALTNSKSNKAGA